MPQLGYASPSLIKKSCGCSGLMSFLLQPLSETLVVIKQGSAGFSMILWVCEGKSRYLLFSKEPVVTQTNFPPLLPSGFHPFPRTVFTGIPAGSPVAWLTWPWYFQEHADIQRQHHLIKYFKLKKTNPRTEWRRGQCSRKGNKQKPLRQSIGDV